MATYRVARLGHRVGTISASAKDMTLHVTVLPKYWRPQDGANVCHWRVPANGVFTVYEGDHLTIDSSSAVTERAIEGHAAIVARFDALARHTEDVEDAADSDGNADHGARRAAPTHAGLLRRVADRTGGTPPGEDANDGGNEALLALMLLEERLQHRAPISGAAHLADDGAAATLAPVGASPVAAVVAAWRFVNEVRKHLRKLRRDYVPIEVVTSNPRGRILPRGFLRVAATGVPALDCEVDAFSKVVPLAEVFASTLEVLAGGWASRLGVFRSVPLVRKIITDASHLRRHLHDVPAPRRDEAAKIASTLRLPPMQRAFNAALADARTILQDDPPGTAVGAADGTSAFVLWFNTSMLWEALLVRAMQTGTGWQVDWNAGGKAKHVLCPGPWHGSADGQPDIVGKFNDCVFVIDAKYKSPPKTPTIADRYQLFAYSHLASFSGRAVDRCLMVYPGKRNAPEIGRWSRSVSASAGTARAVDQPVLVACAVPFVSKEQALEPSALDRYLQAVRRELESALGVKRSQTSGLTPSGDQASVAPTS